jgi:hypothetical protein
MITLEGSFLAIQDRGPAKYDLNDWVTDSVSFDGAESMRFTMFLLYSNIELEFRHEQIHRYTVVRALRLFPAKASFLNHKLT